MSVSAETTSFFIYIAVILKFIIFGTVWTITVSKSHATVLITSFNGLSPYFLVSENKIVNFGCNDNPKCALF